MISLRQHNVKLAFYWEKTVAFFTSAFSDFDFFFFFYRDLNIALCLLRSSELSRRYSTERLIAPIDTTLEKKK